MEISLEQLEKMNSRKNNLDKNVRTLKKRDGRALHRPGMDYLSLLVRPICNSTSVLHHLKIYQRS